MIKRYHATCPKGHQHAAAPMNPELLPKFCRFGTCTEELKWEVTK